MQKKLTILLIIVLGIIKIADAQYKNLAYQLYLLENLYKTSDDSLLSVVDYFALSESSKKRKELISQLSSQIASTNNKINSLSASINQLERDLKLLKGKYAKVLTFIYLTQKTFKNDFYFFLTAKTLQQAFYRYNLLKILLSYLKSLSASINMLKEQLALKKKKLEKYNFLKKQLLTDLIKQKEILKTNYQRELKIIEKLEQNENVLRIKFNEYLKSQEQLVKQVEILKDKFSNDTMQNLTEKFAKAKGKIIPPLDKPIVISSFGVHNNPKFSHITYVNYGIDLASNSDTLVKAVFDGRVVKVIRLPNNVNAVLIKHGDYFTVYNNLNLVFVIDNQIIFKEQLIGTISKKTSSYAFPVLNFQIWYKTKKLDPAKWLKL